MALLGCAWLEERYIWCVPMKSVYRKACLGFPQRGRASIFLGAVAAALMAGCQNTYNLKVDALTRPQTAVAAEQAVSYRIRPKNPSIEEDTLRYREAKEFVKTALSGKGMYEASDPDKADVVVEMDYGVSEPRVKQEVRTEPIYVTIPGRTYTQLVVVGTDAQGNPIYRTITIQEPPTTEHVGDREYLVTVINYEKHLRLSARENAPVAEGRPPPEIWTVDVSSEGESRDLRKYLPALAAATMDYIGTDTGGQKSVKLQDKKDGAVDFVKKGL